ncbi:hypothetical protein [Roseibium sp. RKSG952]|uniref:hypothetical protein n=1 Tax=Roseibium sp. RKSG952 TaxID=2529384 RepID=UPI0012BB9920|nr:hypothetical protein [Roseibium sp. RKSG952]MTH97671.1 hypothetical protein [Roseibium sp. RKSG952]
MKSLTVLCIAAGVGFLPSLAAAQETVPANANPTPPPTYDYVQQAAGMTYDGQSSMTLTGAAPTILYFSDRPYRVAGQLSKEAFADFWTAPEGFGDQPPNAVVSILGQTDKAPAFIELMSSKVDGENVSYTMRVLRGELPASAQNIALFIDQGPGPSGGHGGGGESRGGAESHHHGGHPHNQPVHHAHPYPHTHAAPYYHHQGYHGFWPYGPYCAHAPQDPQCRAWHQPYHPYHPYNPYYPRYYYPGAAYAAGVATGAAVAHSAQPTYYYYPLPNGPLPQNCYVNSTHTQMVCTVPLN